MIINVMWDTERDGPVEDLLNKLVTKPKAEPTPVVEADPEPEPAPEPPKRKRGRPRRVPEVIEPTKVEEPPEEPKVEAELGVDKLVEDDGTVTRERVVERVVKLVQSGHRKEVTASLKAHGVERVAELSADQFESFYDSVKDIG